MVPGRTCAEALVHAPAAFRSTARTYRASAWGGGVTDPGTRRSGTLRLTGEHDLDDRREELQASVPTLLKSSLSGR